MRIDGIDVYRVAMPLIQPWRTAYGEDAAIESLIVRMTSGALEGWGESSPLAAPCYSPEFAAGAFRLSAEWLIPRLLGVDIASGEELLDRLSLFKGNPFAKGAFDSAWWSLESRRRQMPLHELWGARRSVVEVGADFGVMDSLAELLDAVGAAVDAGFPRIKLKFRRGWDLDMLRAVRKQHPDHPFHIDCNSGYRLDDLPLFREVDRFGLTMIEQPLGHDDLVDHAKLQRAIETPICLDESVTSVDRARQALELGSCRYVNIKPGRVGGLTIARRIHDLCADAGVPCWVGGMLESAIGARQCAALAMLDNFTYPADLFPSSRFYREDLGEPPLVLTRSPAGRPAVAAPAELSRPHPQRLARVAIERATFIAKS